MLPRAGNDPKRPLTTQYKAYQSSNPFGSIPKDLDKDLEKRRTSLYATPTNVAST